MQEKVKKVIYSRSNDTCALHWLKVNKDIILKKVEGRGLSLKICQTDLPLFWKAQKLRSFMNENLKVKTIDWSKALATLLCC